MEKFVLTQKKARIAQHLLVAMALFLYGKWRFDHTSIPFYCWGLFALLWAVFVTRLEGSNQRLKKGVIGFGLLAMGFSVRYWIPAIQWAPFQGISTQVLELVLGATALVCFASILHLWWDETVYVVEEIRYRITHWVWPSKPKNE